MRAKQPIIPQCFKWVIEISVDKTWVEDGFEVDDDRATEMLGSQLRYAYGHEYSAKVLGRPSKKLIQHVQGYSEKGAS